MLRQPENVGDNLKMLGDKLKMLGKFYIAPTSTSPLLGPYSLGRAYMRTRRMRMVMVMSMTNDTNT